MRKRMGWIGLGLLCGSLLLSVSAQPGPAVAQSGGSCEAALAATVAEASARCADLPEGTVCPAGNVTLTGADGQPLASGQQSLEAVKNISTAGFDTTGESVGVSVLRVPGLVQGQVLSAILFGDATLSPAEAPPIGPACTATSIGTVNVRSTPSTDAAILGQMTVNQSAPITARLADSTWWQVAWEDQTAWVFAELTPTTCDPATMLVADPATGELSGGLPAPAYQSATLVSGFGAPVCAGAPRGGLLLQSTEGGAAWRLNSLRITLDGTALVQIGANDVLVVSVLEGEAGLDYGRVVRTASAGQMLRAPLLAGLPAGLPGPALDRVSPDAVGAPLALLPRPVTVTAQPVASPAVSDAGSMACGLLPQQTVVASADGAARLALTVDPAQRVRVSVAAEGLQGLALLGPDGAEVTRGGISDMQTPGVLVVDTSLRAAGDYALEAEVAPDQVVTFGVTCDLPEVAALPRVLACEDFLLRWDQVSGNEVQFSAPAGATISAIVTHDLPSEGPAARLDLEDEAGNALGEVSFLGVGTTQAAGPLEATLDAGGTYTLRWDGDPFNVVSVEAVCQPPQPAPTETPAP